MNNGGYGNGNCNCNNDYWGNGNGNDIRLSPTTKPAAIFRSGLWFPL